MLPRSDSNHIIAINKVCMESSTHEPEGQPLNFGTFALAIIAPFEGQLVASGYFFPIPSTHRYSYFFHYCFISEYSNILLLLIQGHFRRSQRKSLSSKQAVEFPAVPIILEITACAILLPAQFLLGCGWAAAGCSLLPRARARARTWSEENAGGVGCGGWREVSCGERSHD